MNDNLTKLSFNKLTRSPIQRRHAKFVQPYLNALITETLISEVEII